MRGALGGSRDRASGRTGIQRPGTWGSPSSADQSEVYNAPPLTEGGLHAHQEDSRCPSGALQLTPGGRGGGGSWGHMGSSVGPDGRRGAGQEEDGGSPETGRGSQQGAGEDAGKEEMGADSQTDAVGPWSAAGAWDGRTRDKSQAGAP